MRLRVDLYSDPLRDHNAQIYYTPGSTGVTYDSAQPYVQSAPNWKRTGYGGGYDDHDDRGDWAYYGLIGDQTPLRGMEAFAHWVGFAALASILPAMIAFIVRAQSSLH